MRSHLSDTVAAGRRKSALTAAELYGGFTNSTLYKNRAPRVFFLKLAKYPAWAKSCDTCAVAFSLRRLLVYSTGRRLRNSKKRSRRNFESGFATHMPLYNVCAEGVFRELAKCPARAKSCDTCAVAFSLRRLLVYSTGRRLRNSKKNVADFNFELLIIYQVYCIIIVTREKRFARRGTRATTESLRATGLRRF